MDRRKFLKAGMLGGIASSLPVSSAQATETVEPIPGALGMLYDSTLCVGCQACVAECQNVNHTPVNPKGDQTWSNNDKLTPFTRNVIQVWSDGDGTNKDKTENGYAYVKKQCMHCVDPNCVAVCPVQALTKDPKNGIVKYDPDICTGCRYCMVGCPFDVPKYDYDNPFGEISKCELCNQKGVGNFTLCRETFAGAGSTQNQAIGVLQLLPVHHDKVVGQGVQAVIQAFFAGLVQFLCGERNEDGGAAGGQPSLNFDLAICQRQAAHQPLLLLKIKAAQVAVVLLGDGAGLKDIVFQFLLRAPGVQHQKSDEEHPLVLALQFLQKRLGISAVSRQI